MTIYQQAFLGQFVLADTELNLTVGGSAILLVAAEYYGAGVAPTLDTDIQLLEHIEDQIRAAGGDLVDITVRLSLTTGLVTFDFQGHTTAVVWDDTDLMDLLGFTAGLSGATSYTGTYPMRYLWLPSQGPSEYPPVGILNWWEPVSSSVVQQAPGAVTCGSEGEITNQALVVYDLLANSEVQKPLSPTYDAEENGTFQSFWLRVAHATSPVRIVPDSATYAASTDYKLGLFSGRGGKPLGRYVSWIRLSQGKSNHSLIDVTTYWVEHVAA